MSIAQRSPEPAPARPRPKKAPRQGDAAAAKKPPAKRSAGLRQGDAARAEAERTRQILDTLQALYPDATCELVNWQTPVQLLVAVILSAQCTDARVNQITSALFRRFPDAAAFAASDPAELQHMIHSTGFFRNKAKNIRGACQLLVEQHGGQVPRTMAELLELPGVARKTANVVLGTAYDLTTGVVVDTHITRLAQRLSLTQHSDPLKIERDLMARWPKERWISAAQQIIWHGRRVCHARRPRCDTCALFPVCPAAEPL